MSNPFAPWMDTARPVTAILMRHAEREHFEHPADGATVPITENGARQASGLGRALARLTPLHLVHSPVGRCRQTAEAILAGASDMGSPVSIVGEDGRLGGPYLLDVPRALEVAGTLGHRFVREWLDGRLPATLFKPRRASALEQIDAVEHHLRRARSGLVVLVTHDWNLLAVREEMFGLRREEDRWPGFLDGLVLWRSDHALHVAFGERVVTLLDGER